MLLLSLILLLLSNAVTLRRDKSILYSRTAIYILIYTNLVLYFIINIIYLQKSISIYNGLLYCKNHTIIFTMFILILTAFILLLTSFYPRKIWSDKTTFLYPMLSGNRSKRGGIFAWNENYIKAQPFGSVKPLHLSLLNKTAEQFKIIEYPLIILFIITGGTFLMSSSDLVSIFLSIELQSYGLYLLCSIYRNSELATNAGLTYFLLGGLSSCIILLGQSLLYINSGNTYLDAIYIINSIFTNETLCTIGAIPSEDAAQNVILTRVGEPLNFLVDQYYIQLSMVILSIGFLFKVSAAPFHFWSPDVYDAIPTVVTTFVAIIAKITIFIFFLELVYYTSITSLDFSWNNNLLLSSLLSLIIGSVLGLTQYRIKRLFAYSTISHVGFILLALSINSIESIQAFYFYLIQYSITNLNAFMILIAIGYSFLLLNTRGLGQPLIGRAEEYLRSENIVDNYISALASKGGPSVKNKKEKYVKVNNLDNKVDCFSPVQLISQIKGFFFINPVLAISLAITIFSFVGVPPLIGFFAKQMILSAALDNGYIFMSLIAILTSVIGAVYYLAIIKELFFERSALKQDKTRSEENGNTILAQSIFLSGSLTITISILTLFILGFIFMPKELMYLTSILGLVY